MKALFAGKWAGGGFAKFPTIEATAYTELIEFIPDEYKDAIFYQQKTWYHNDTNKNGHTVFWDTGFILLREDKIFLNSSQAGVWKASNWPRMMIHSFSTVPSF